jgi:hypothetical protein
LVNFGCVESHDQTIIGSWVCVMQWTGVIRDETLIEKDIWRFLLIVFYLERTNQLSLLLDKDLVDLCHLIEPYQAEMLNPYIKLYIQADENRRSLREIKFPSCDKIKLT